MPVRCKLAAVILVLTLGSRVHTGEIIRGHEAAKHSRPYMVLLERHQPDGRKKHCGGFLLKDDFVMTAAHCQAKSYRVILGLHSYHDQNGVQSLSVRKAFPHKDYNKNNLKNDIMLLKLNSKVNISENVSPIALADPGDGVLPQSCTVSGWGETEQSSRMSVELREASVTLIENETYAEKNVYCSEGESGPGKGDSGGPLVCEDGKAYGVVSGGKPHGHNSTIYLYAKIPYNRDWIDNIMKNNRRF